MSHPLPIRRPLLLLWALLLLAAGGAGCQDDPPPKPPHNEGTPEAPHSLAGTLLPDGSLRYTGQVGEGGSSHYLLAGLSPGSVYAAGLEAGTGPLDLLVEMDTGAGYLEDCASAAGSAAGAPMEEACPFQAGGLPHRLRVQNSGPPTRFLLYLRPLLHYPREGTPAAPADLNGVSNYRGTIGREVLAGESWFDPSSFYRLSGLTPGDTVALTLWRYNSNYNLYLHADPEFITPICAADVYQGATNHGGWKQCSALVPGGGSLYARIANANILLTPGHYTLQVDPPLNSQGDAAGNPVPLAGGLPYAGQVGRSAASYYALGGLNAGERWLVLLDGGHMDLNLGVYADGAFPVGSPLCTSDLPGVAARESCVATVPPAGALYIQAGGGSHGGAFTLDARPVPEGGVAAPMHLTGALPHAGAVDDSTSFYQVDGLSPGGLLLGWLDGAREGAVLTLADPATPGLPLCQGFAVGGRATCAATVPGSGPGSGSLSLQVGGLAAGAGSAYTVGLQAPQGAPGAPWDLTGNLPHRAWLDPTPGAAPHRLALHGLTPQTFYRVRIIDFVGNVEVEVFADNTFTGTAIRGWHYNTAPREDVAWVRSSAEGSLFLSVYILPPAVGSALATPYTLEID